LESKWHILQPSCYLCLKFSNKKLSRRTASWIITHIISDDLCSSTNILQTLKGFHVLESKWHILLPSCYLCLKCSNKKLSRRTASWIIKHIISDDLCSCTFVLKVYKDQDPFLSFYDANTIFWAMCYIFKGRYFRAVSWSQSGIYENKPFICVSNAPISTQKTKGILNNHHIIADDLCSTTLALAQS